MRRLCLLALAAIAALGVSMTSPAHAAPLVIAPVPAEVPISALRGWVVWSVPVGERWGLDAWHDGKVTSLPVITRDQPFDLDLGTDENGHVVATFTRCSMTPQVIAGRSLPWTGNDCGIAIFDLVGGKERRAAIPRPEGASDTTPSIWRGRIAFGRSTTGRDVQQLELWTPPSDTTSTLRHGAIPTNCPFRSCRGTIRRGAVQGLDLGTRLVAFLWSVDAPAVAGHGGWEVRADRLSDGRSFLAGSGLAGEVCTGATDLVLPSTPTVDGYEVWYSSFSSACYVGRASVAHFRTRQRRGIIGSVPGQVIQFAKDGRDLYALVAPKPAGETAPTCAGPGGPCLLQRIDPPARFRPLRRPTSPFF